MASAGGDGPERTVDGRWIVVDGRRWRATDPSIPAKLREELVDELMHARRDVGAAKRMNDDAAEQEHHGQHHEDGTEQSGAGWQARPGGADGHSHLISSGALVRLNPCTPAPVPPAPNRAGHWCHDPPH